MTLSRRRFLTLGGCSGILLATGCSRPGRLVSTLSPPTIPSQPTIHSQSTIQSQSTSMAGSSDTVLVLVQLLGGNDGLNMIVPRTGSYRDVRPTLAIPEADLMELGSSSDLGFHPALASLAPLWENGHLAAAVGVGFEEQDRSHFRSRDIWWRAADDPSADGWLARWMEVAAIDQPDQPMEALALGAGARALAGAGVSAVRDPTDLSLSPPGSMTEAAYEQFLLDLADGADSDNTFLAEARTAGPAALSTQKILNDATDETAGSAYVERSEPTLDLQLQTAATLIATRPELRVVTVGIEGFDTHVDQLDEHAALLGVVADSLSRFWNTLSAVDRSRTLVMTTSEFGRRLAENGSGGTDHGRAGAQLLLGGGVAGAQIIGSYGDGGDAEGDVAISIPALDLYAEALRWLGGPVSDVLGQAPPPTGILA